MAEESMREVSDLSPLVGLGTPVVVLSGRSGAARDVLTRRAFGRALLREAAARSWGVPVERLAVTATCARCGGDHGPPVVTDSPSGRRALGSVTHAGPVSIAAIGGATVGIDAEPIDGDPTRFAAIRDVTGRTAPEAPDGVGAVLVWTAIEAVLKADGRGLEVDPRRVRLEGPPGASRSMARVDDTGARFALSAFVTDGLVVTVAAPAGRAD